MKAVAPLLIRTRRRSKKARLDISQRGDAIRAMIVRMAQASRRMPTFAEMVRRLGVPNRRAVNYHLRKLVERGFVVRVQSRGNRPVLRLRARGRAA